MFPHMVIQMIAVGEKSSELDAMLTKIANIYEDDVDRTLSNLNILLEPIILLILGIIIGAFVLAMYLPIFKMGTLV